ncbi:hypothetical protein T492DRAFT_873922 [Pavlovales sp. CCMP2436]|nr:hypothetical protein T492DRAFT_873922 [Pavlovales sp. CCMP2436]
MQGQARDARLKLGALPPSPLSALLLPTATYASLAAACALALANALHVPNTLEALAVDKEQCTMQLQAH